MIPSIDAMFFAEFAAKHPDNGEWVFGGPIHGVETRRLPYEATNLNLVILMTRTEQGMVLPIRALHRNAGGRLEEVCTAETTCATSGAFEMSVSVLPLDGMRMDYAGDYVFQVEHPDGSVIAKTTFRLVFNRGFDSICEPEPK